MWDISIGLYLLIWVYFYWTNLKFEFGLKYLFWALYISGYLSLTYFCFCTSSFQYSINILLVKYEFKTREALNFMEENETRKAVGEH